jgi:hypothetical protein
MPAKGREMTITILYSAELPRQAAPGYGAGPPPRASLRGAQVLILDPSETAALLLRRAFEDAHNANVETVDTYDDALDVLGNAARPVDLVAMDTQGCNFAAGAILELLRLHKARIHITLHGVMPPEDVPFAGDLVGAAAYTHLATSSAVVAAAETVIAGGLTVREIIERRTVPATLDWQSAIAIYGAEPGAPFPITLKT